MGLLGIDKRMGLTDVDFDRTTGNHGEQLIGTIAQQFSRGGVRG